MKVLLLLLFVAIAATQSDQYHDGIIFDKYNIIEILGNDAQRRSVLGCVMGHTPCGEYQLIKDKGPNIVRTKCEDCTPEQKAKFEEAIKKLETEHHDEFIQVMAKLLPVPPA